MKLRFIYIIACLFVAILASNELLASARLTKAENREVCDDCDTSRGTNQNAEERAMEEEHKLLAAELVIPSPLSVIFINKGLYMAPHIAAINLGVLTPPPKQNAIFKNAFMSKS